MKKSDLQKLAINFSKRLAYLTSSFLMPMTIFEWTGFLPIKKQSYQDFSPVQYKDQTPFPNERPRSIRGSDCWISTPTSPMVMGHLLKINYGMVSCSGYVFDQSGGLIDGASHRYTRKIKRGLVSHPYRVMPHIENFKGVVAAITASNHDAYFHWLFDLLPRLKILEDFGVKPEKIYLQYHYRFQRETLELLDMVATSDIINCNDVPLLSASTLIVPCHEVMDGREFPEWVIEFLRNKFLPEVKNIDPHHRTRIYVSRADALFRRVLNEHEILPILDEYGFTVVKLETLSFQEQVTMFMDAEAVVLPHGSGLANLVFCSKGTRVIELLPSLVLDHGFRLSTAVGLDYFFLNSRDGDSQLIEGASHSGNIPYDFKINPKDLIDSLQLAGIDRLSRVKASIPSLPITQSLKSEYVQRPALGVK